MDEPHPRGDIELRPLIATVTVGALMVSLDLTVVNIALETLARSLHSTVGSVQWVTTSYALTIAAVVPCTGWVARRFGTRRVYVVALSGFAIASALCGLAWSVPSLIVFRLLQGLSGGMVGPVGSTILGRAAGPKRMARAMATVGSVVVVSPILGPTFGGLILDHLSWRWIFLVNVPVGAFAVILALRNLPHTHAEPAGKLDWRGLILLGSGLPLLTYGLAEAAQGRGLIDAGAPIALGIVAIVLFGRHAWRTERPLLEVRLYRIKSYAFGAIGTFANGLAVFGPYLLMPLFYQQVQGASAFRAGLLFAPQGLGAALGIRYGAPHSDRFGGGRVAVVGTSIMSLATVPFLIFGVSTPAWQFVLVLLVRGIGIGLTTIPFQSSALAAVPKSEIADASPQLYVLRLVGGAIGTAVFAIVLAQRLGGTTNVSVIAAAYHHTFAWVIAVNLLTIIPAAILAWFQRRGSPAARLEPAAD